MVLCKFPSLLIIDDKTHPITFPIAFKTPRVILCRRGTLPPPSFVSHTHHHILHSEETSQSFSFPIKSSDPDRAPLDSRQTIHGLAHPLASQQPFFGFLQSERHPFPLSDRITEHAGSVLKGREPHQPIRGKSGLIFRRQKFGKG